MLYVLGVSSIKEFTLPMMVGIVAGACSSVFLTGPIWYWMRTTFGRDAKEYRAMRARAAKAEAKKNTASPVAAVDSGASEKVVREGGNPNVIRKKKTKKHTAEDFKK